MYLGRGLKGRVDGNLWHVPVVDVLVAVPHTVDQVSLKSEDKTGVFKCLNPVVTVSKHF